MTKFMLRFLRTENGTTAIEYGLIVAFAVVVVIGAFQALGQTVVNVLYNNIIAIL